jgi:hypothetical protein
MRRQVMAARIVGRLKSRQVANAKPPRGKDSIDISDGGNLFLQVTRGKGGHIRRSWTFKYELAGKRHELGLGATHTIGLAEARDRARALRQMLLDGLDPLVERRKRQQELILGRRHNRRARPAERAAVSESDREAVYDLFGIPHWRAHSLLGLADRQGVLDSQSDIIDQDRWFEARTELIIDGAKVEWERKWSDDVRDYLLERIKEPVRGRITKRARDRVLNYVIKDLHEKYNLPPTRNRSRHGSRENLSGCALVAIVLAELGKAIDESTVERIWEARSD